jgi:acetylornithine/succinyldiaminopimelate/putrescine aminotransferase
MPLGWRWFVAAIVVVGIAAVTAAIERRERLRGAAAIAKALSTYQVASLARAQADAAVKEYADVTLPREAATAAEEIKAAQAELNDIQGDTDPAYEWAERCRQKGYLVLVYVPSKQLVVRRAEFAVEQAKSRKRVLEAYTSRRTLPNLNDVVANARQHELATKAVYDSAKAARIGFLGRIIRRQAPR